MANRTCIFAVDKVPSRFDDRPNSITGLSEWPYALPLSYMLLVSADTRKCSSPCFSDNGGVPVSALAGDWDGGAERLFRLLDLLTKTERGMKNPAFLQNVEETRNFLAANRQRYVLLETAEVDVMNDEDLEIPLNRHMESIRDYASLVDHLTLADLEAALESGGRLEGLLSELGKFEERELPTLGVSYWSNVLYFSPANSTEFVPAEDKPQRAEPPPVPPAVPPPVPPPASEGLMGLIRRLLGRR